MKESPTKEQVEAAVSVAEEAVSHSRDVRKRVGRRRTPSRGARLKAARDRCSSAAEPLRSFIGMVAWHDLPVELELSMKNVMQSLRYERRQIDKMQDKKGN